MTEVCSAKVVERQSARQTQCPVIHEIVPQHGRLAVTCAEPEQLPEPSCG
jgi:hypothetical protein